MDNHSPLCSVATCNRDRHARDLCRAHYDRLQKFGDARAHVPLRRLPTRAERTDFEARIFSNARLVDSGCVEWLGEVTHSGYGVLSWEGRAWVVHRLVWELTVGPIPTDDDWTIDHLCRNRRCLLVDHLEVVTRIENTRRGGGLLVAQASNAVRYSDACKNGHRRTPENTGLYNGVRYCRECKHEQWAKYAAKRRAG